MKTWAVALLAFSFSGNASIHLIFISAFDKEEALEKGLKACDIVYPVSKGYKDHRVAIRDTQVMHEEVRFIKEWDK